jgi:hypothetical protein
MSPVEQKEKMTCLQTAQIAEDAWIAKYRAALEAPPVQSPRMTFREGLRNAFHLFDSRLHAMLAYAKQALQHGLFRQPARRAVQPPQAASRRNRIDRRSHQKNRKTPLKAA